MRFSGVSVCVCVCVVQFGVQHFHLQGEGLQPLEMDPLEVMAQLTGSNVAIVKFINPLGHPAHFGISLSDNANNQFCLLLKVTRDILLQPNVSIDIPVVFAPEFMVLAKTSVIISTAALDSEEGLKWTYPIIGQPELKVATSHGFPHVIGRARERTEYRLKLTLTSTAVHNSSAVARPVTPGNSLGRAVSGSSSSLWKKYTYELACTEEGEKVVLSRATGVKLVGEEHDSQNQSTILTFDLVFLPSKPFRYVHVHLLSEKDTITFLPSALNLLSAYVPSFKFRHLLMVFGDFPWNLLLGRPYRTMSLHWKLVK